MVYRRKGRPSFTFSARTRTGWEDMGTGAKAKPLALKVAAMWDRLSGEYRAWDLLDPILAAGRDRQRALLALYDAYAAVDGNLQRLRHRVRDADVVALLPDWEASYRRGVKGDSADHARHHVHWLFEGSAKRAASTVTTAWLTERLSAYPGKRNTLRKVHSNWSVFFAYATKVRGLFPVNPMEAVPRPRAEESPIRFYELDAVDRIVGHQAESERRAFYALAYGTGIEVTVALGLTVADVFVEGKEIRAAGTKAHARDRVARVADWAWPFVLELVRGKLPTARLFPADWDRWKVSKAHRSTVIALGLPVYPLHSARDHWAVRQLRAGAPVAVVAAQLGHGSPTLTLRKYGRFIPSAVDRSKWEQAATRDDQKRRAK